MINPSSGTVKVREYSSRAILGDERREGLSAEAQAALRQFTVDRLVGYGVDPADAQELHERVLRGQGWQYAATELANVCISSAAGDAMWSFPTRITYLRRGSALLRMSQVMMLTDTVERRQIYAAAAELYAQAAVLSLDRSRVTIDTPAGLLAGWLISGGQESVGSAIVIGGIEGYAMDFQSLGDSLAARQIDTLLLDGPGQGESRFTHRHYLGPGWRDAYRSAIDFLADRAPGRPIAFIGNSMGGSIAMAVTATDRRVVACCENGGIPAPWMVPPSMGTFFSKMVAFCGTNDPQSAVSVWETVTPLTSGSNIDYALLVIHGGDDPLVSAEMAQTLLITAPTEHKQMVVFSDGNHCIYNHKSDRDMLIADWARAQLDAVAIITP
ncbi:alpha/beta fold hydrolase [Arthrobacter sp. ISL-48]|uniref:alpha/beta hydrolase n=1 Tax=Arthrobacter sp. ISL-48 TaxID=2819110 RepID=UPI001BE78876|nr:alpha/beta fold hydrolase [Arthrobacter sp. ISL-48]MBT2534509.1 alpha/beta fold hydrolase [Arthrobacter sp. ISL-48]